MLSSLENLWSLRPIFHTCPVAVWMVCVIVGSSMRHPTQCRSPSIACRWRIRCSLHHGSGPPARHLCKRSSSRAAASLLLRVSASGQPLPRLPSRARSWKRRIQPRGAYGVRRQPSLCGQPRQNPVGGETLKDLLCQESGGALRARRDAGGGHILWSGGPGGTEGQPDVLERPLLNTGLAVITDPARENPV